MPRNIRNHLAIAAADDVMKPHKMLTLAGRLFFGAFNLARSEPYMPSLEYAGQLLDRRWYMTVAPEGKISVDGALQPFKSGIGLLTVEGQVPVVPVKTIGLRTMPLHSTWPKRRSKVTVRIGEPIRFVPGTDYDTAARKLHDAMRRL
jgi:1-acyl-sn-glycerol-3-phosphate acyltransferase